MEIYESLRLQAEESFNQGNLVEALDLFNSALSRAQNLGDEVITERAFCNLVAVEIELGRAAAEDLIRLREILMRNSDLENCRLAAYNLAQEYQIRKSYKKALFYARIALDKAMLIGSDPWIASSHNRIGNILISESHFGQACLEYEQALEAMPTERSMARALVLDNLGYCRIVEGNFNQGFRLLYESLRTLRRIGAKGFERGPRLSRCFALLEVGRYRAAYRHGLTALTIAEPVGDPDALKNALYLLGEAANLARNTKSARGHFNRLQQQFFPQEHYLPDFLLAIDVRKLINL